MRTESDFLGNVELPDKALYGIHSFRANKNFPNNTPFPIEWYQSVAKVKIAAYLTIKKFLKALEQEDPEMIKMLKLPEDKIIDALIEAASEVSNGEHFDNFIIPGIQGGAGTSINMNLNEIISNRALQIIGLKAGDYKTIDPIETSNIFQSTNDVIPTSLVVTLMRMLIELEAEVNVTRSNTEKLEKKYRSVLRLAYTQLQAAVPGTYGQLFSSYSDTLSRDWWRISKANERIKQVNLGGGAIGTGLSIPRFYIMEVVNQLRQICDLPLAQGENLADITSNMDSLVEVHAILKAHAVNLEKIASDLRLLSSDIHNSEEMNIPAMQTGSSIMPGKVNPVVPEYIISSAHHIYSNDLLITSLCGQGNLDLNAYLPSIGLCLIQSVKLLISMNQSLSKNLLEGIEINQELSENKLFSSPAVTTALTPIIGYNKASSLANYMKKEGIDIFAANLKLNILPPAKLNKLMEPEFLLKKGFSIKDIREFK